MCTEKECDHLIERIYARYDDVVRKLMRRGVDRSEAPDLAVKLMLDAVEAIPQLRNEENLESWLSTIVLNGTKKYFKERSKALARDKSFASDLETGEETDIYETMADEMTVENILRHADTVVKLNELLTYLDETERKIFLMRALHQYKFKYIAEMVGKKENTVKTIHRRTCAKLEKLSLKLFGKEAYYD